MGDEGGFAPDVQNANQTIELILTALRDAGLEKKFGIALDVAASEFFVQKDGKSY